jgi:hypothetical protein
MVGSRMKWIGKLGMAMTAALIALAVGPLAPAGAAGPNVVIETPNAGARINQQAPLLGGSTDDALDPISLSIVEEASGTQVLSETLPEGMVWSLQGPVLGEGTYTVVATQVSSITGEAGVSPQVTFTIDRTAPAVSLSPIASPTNDTTPTFVGSLGTDPGDVSAVSVTVHAGTSVEGPVVKSGSAAIGGGVWSYTPSPLAGDGPYTVQVSQLDEAGNAGASATQTFTLDTGRPKISIAQTPSPSKNRTPTFTWTPGSAEGDLPLVKLTVLNGKHEVMWEESSSVGSLTIGVADGLEDGTYTARVEQSDEAGNTATASETFTVDNVPPSVSISSPEEGAHLNSAKPSFKGTASGEGGDVTLNIYQGTTVTGEHETLTISPKGGSWSEPEGPHLADGTYTAQVLQEDAAGNLGEAKRTFTIETNTPHVTLNRLPEYTSDATPSFSGTVDTTKGVVESVTLRIFHGTSPAESAELAEPPIVVAGNGANWSTGATEHLADGTYTAQAEQENEAGTPGFSARSTFIVDTASPLPTLSAPSDSTGTETVSGAAGVAPGDRAQITVELFKGPSAESGEAFEVLTIKATGASWSATFAGLGAGQYTVLARQSDEAGNTGSSAAQSFTVNTPPAPAGPSAPVASFTWVPQTPTVGQSVSLVSKSTDASSAITGYGWDMVGSGPFAPGGPLATVTFSTPGVHTVRLQVSDANGLSSTAAEAIQVVPQALTLMQPFPIVRIAGAETANGARIRLLTVQAPPAAKVSVSCKGRGCKTKSETRLATVSSKSKGKSRAGAITLAFPRFQRTLGAGAVLQIRVIKNGQIGKFTSFKIRRKKLPVRLDACLRSPSTAPSPCPSQ